MLAEIDEARATGETARIYAEVRRLWGVPYVSAIHRHLATRPGVLEWAWEAVGPAFASGAAQQAGWRAAEGLGVAPLAPIPKEALAVWGVDAQATAHVRATAESFVRVAPVNMMFAGLVKALFAGDRPGGRTGGVARPEGAWTPPPPLPPPPSMLAPESLDPAARAVLMRFATSSDGKPFVPGLWRMLAHWPELLAHLAVVLPPRLAAHETIAAFDTLRSRVDAAVPGVLATLPSGATRLAMPDAGERTHFLAVGATYRKTSPELVVLGRLVADALP